MKSTLLLSVLLFGFTLVKAQQTLQQAPPHDHGHVDEFRFQTEFDADSLRGFNEEAALQQARINGLPGWHQRRFVAGLKRNFIDYKYHLAKPAAATAPDPTPQAACTNVDFETGTIAGWTTLQGHNDNSLTHAISSTGATSLVVPVTPGNDPNLGATLQRVPAGGGGYAVRLGSTTSSAGGWAYRMTQTFNVTAANSVFIYNYAVVLNDGSHQCDEQPYFNIAFVDCNNNPIACGQYSVTAPGASCSSGVDPSFQTSGAWKYKPWTTAAFDLSSYIGQCVTIEFTVAGCVYTQGAHTGYAYVDCSCQPMTLTYNNVPIPVGQNTSPFCQGVTTNTLCAPSGFGYNWTGPGVTGYTTQCISTSSAGSYSVTLTQPGAGVTCFNPILYANLIAAPSPTLTPQLTQPVCASPVGSATIVTTGGTGPFNYTWTPAATTGTTVGGLVPGSTYSVFVLDNMGCTASTSFSIDIFPGAPSFTTSATPVVLDCANPTTTLSVMPTDPNTSTSWSGPGGPIAGTSTVVSSPGTYTYTAINTVSTCSLTSYIVVSSNVISPVGTFTAACNVATITLDGTAVSPAGSTAAWTGPSGALTNPAVVTSTGIYTLTITDPATGCVSNYTTNIATIGAPDVAIIATPGNSLTCITTSIAAAATSTTSGTTYVWSTPSGTTATNPLPVNQPGTYTAVVTNTNSGCYNTVTLTVTSNTTAPVVSITGNSLIPCSSGQLTLTANGASSYTWSPSSPVATGSTYTVGAPGNYNVVGINAANGCTASATGFSVGTETVDASFTASPNSGMMPLAVTFSNTSTNATSYGWTFGNGSGSTATNPATVYPAQGTYTVILTATNGVCQDTAMTIIYVDLLSFLEIPNVFTPNGDGTNDVFTLKAMNLGEVSISILDRWGLKMFEVTGTGNISWDGTNKGGSTVADGTYFYMLHATGLDNKTYDLQGTINVFR